jgi:hypothetical protein
VGHAHEYSTQVTPLRQYTLVVRWVGDELEALEVDGLILGELHDELVDTLTVMVSSGKMNHQNV